MMLALVAQMGLDDWAAFVGRYWPDLMLAALFIGGVAFMKFAKRSARFRCRLAALILLMAAAVCGGHVAVTAKRNLTLTLLGAEDDRLAEAAYQDFAKRVTLKQAARLATDRHENDNVRFYAAYLTSELLATNDEQTVVRILRVAQDAPDIRPRFFGTNRVNAEFIALAKPVVVKNLIEHRLRKIRESKAVLDAR